MTKPLRLRIETREGASFERDLEGQECLLGRAPTADILLADPLVSRQHARFYRSGDEWWVEDLGARNRTYLNDRALSLPSPLRAGDVLRIGHSMLKVLGDQAIAAFDATPLPAAFSQPVFVATAPPDTHFPVSSVDGDTKASERLQLLDDVHRALAVPVTLPDLFDRVLERGFALLRPEAGIILLKSRDGELRAAATRTVFAEVVDVPISRRIVQEVVENGQSALVLDVPQATESARPENLLSADVRSIVAAPLRAGDDSLGMIAFCSRASVRRFAHHDLESLLVLASAAALRMGNILQSEETVGQRLIEHELLLAREVQAALLPRELPQRREVAVAAGVEPARLAATSLYDVVDDGGRMWFVVARVGDKGVSAALRMTVAITAFRALTPAASVEALARHVDHELRRDSHPHGAVSALFGCLEPGSGTVQIVNAGQGAPLILKQSGAAESRPDSSMPPLGGQDTPTFRVDSFALAANDTLVVCTPDVAGLHDASGVAFDRSALERSLSAHVGQPVADIAAGLLEDIRVFRAGIERQQDFAVLVLQYRGPASQ